MYAFPAITRPLIRLVASHLHFHSSLGNVIGTEVRGYTLLS